LFVIYFCSLDAEKMMQVSFSNLYFAIVPADMVQKYHPCVMLHQFYQPFSSSS